MKCVTPTPTSFPVNVTSLIWSALPHYSLPYQLFRYSQYLPFLLILFGIFCFLSVLILLYLRVRYYYQQTKIKTVLLEVKPPYDVKQSAFATEKLISTIHSLGRNISFGDALTGKKKTYTLELVSTKEKGIRYLIRTNPMDALVIQKNVLAYLPDAVIQEAQDYLPQRISGFKTHFFDLLEFRLFHHFSLPLRKQTALSEHDPIAYLTGHMTQLNEDELISFQVILTPLLTHTHAKEISVLKSLDAHIYNGLDISHRLKSTHGNLLLNVFFKLLKFYISLWLFFLLTPFTLFFWILTRGSNSPVPFWLFFSKKPKKENELSEEQKRIQQFIKGKIGTDLFETSIRIFLVQKDKFERTSRIKGLISSFSPFTNENYQGLAVKSPFPFFRYLRFLQTFQFFNFKNRLLSLSNNPILSSSEVSDLYHFPYTATTKTEDLAKVITPELPAPLALKNETSLDVVFGKSMYGNKETLIGLTDEDRSRHVFIEGQTGSGKSTVMYHMAKDDIKKGRGVCVIDPHGDLIEDLLAVIPDNRIDDVVYINPFDIKFPIRINLLELPPDLDEDELELEKELVVENIISIFRRVFSDDGNTNAHRIEHILRNTIYTAFYVKDATIFTVNKLLTNEQFRNEVLSSVDNEDLLDFWKGEFGKAGEWQVFKMIDGVTAKIERFLFSPIAKRILEKPHSTISFEKLLDEGKIILCNLSEGKLGEDTSRLLGVTIITQIHLAMLRRSRMEKALRKPFYLFVDEFQNFATKSFTKLLSGGRKFELRVTVAEQSTMQQDDFRITNIILANVGTVTCFRTASPIDEDIMLSQFAPLVKKGNLQNLPRFHFYIKLGALEPQEPFSGVTLPIESEKDLKKIHRIIAASRTNYASVYERPKRLQVQKKNVKQKKKKSLGSLSDD